MKGASLTLRVQGKESVEEFVRDLQAKVKNCGYIDSDDQVRDRLVIGLKDPALKEKLELEADLTLGKAITIAHRSELIKEQIRMQSGHEANEIQSQARSQGRGHSQGRGRGHLQGRGRSRGCGWGRGSNHYANNQPAMQSSSRIKYLR